MKLSEALEAVLRDHDERVASCPMNNGSKHDIGRASVCPRCNATASDPCPVLPNMGLDVIAQARAALKEAQQND